MNVTIQPGRLAGTVTPPASKSQAHRAVLAQALAGGGGTLEHLPDSQDIQATRACVAAIREDRGGGTDGLPVLDCGESGSTLRFLIPVALALRGGGHFTGRGRLMDRPQDPYFEIFREKGIFYERTGAVLTVRGRLEPGEYRLRGDVSSQFVTGLLYALPLLPGDSEIVLTTPLESRDYVAMTLDMLEKFGVHAENRGYRTFSVPGGQRFRARDLAIEADWSQAAFWYAARYAGNPVTVSGMDDHSLQGDRVFTDWCRRLERRGAGDTVSLDVSQNPDLVPPLAALAAVTEGTVAVTNAARLRLKESDRLATVAEVLRALGAQVLEEADRLTVTGREILPGGVAVDSHNDHRIAMMAAVAATRCQRPVTVTGAQCVAKSYPLFWEDYARLGGRLEREDAP